MNLEPGWLTRRFRFSAGERHSNGRLALGCAIGMAIGLVPKDSLIVPVLIVLLFCSMADLWCGLASSILFTGIGYLLDGLTQKLGALVLTSEKLESAWVYLYELPLLPWTRFNNTAVMGNLILACLLCYPVYRFSALFFNAYGPYFHRAITKSFIYRWLISRETTSTVEGVQ